MWSLKDMSENQMAVMLRQQSLSGGQQAAEMWNHQTFWDLLFSTVTNI